MPGVDNWHDAIQKVMQCLDYVSSNETKNLRKTLKAICSMPLLEDLKEENPNGFEAIQISVSDTIDAVPSWCTAKTMEARNEAAIPLREGLEAMLVNFESLKTDDGVYENIAADFVPPASDDEEASDESDSDEEPTFVEEPQRRKSVVVQQLGSTTDLGPEMTAKFQGVVANLEQLFNSASVANAVDVENTLFEINKQLVVIEKFLGPVNDQSEEERHSVTAWKDACLSTQTLVRDKPDFNVDQVMGAVVNLHVVIQEFFNVIQRMKFLSTIKGSPSAPFLARLQRSLDDVATPKIQDEEVAFIEYKQVVLVAQDAITVSCQRLTASLLAPTPSNWKMVSACDQLVHSICGLVRICDKLHKDQQSPNRRILYELSQFVIGGIGLLMELKSDMEESRSEFHATVNSLHVYIPALNNAADNVVLDCLEIIRCAELKELSQEELDRDITDQITFEVPESVEEIEKKASISDSRKLEIAVYLCTDKVESKEGQKYRIGRVLTFPKVSGSLTISNLKTVLQSRYVTPPTKSMVVLAASRKIADDEKLAAVAGEENDYIQLFLYIDVENTLDVEKQLENLSIGEYPKPGLFKQVSPKEEKADEGCCKRSNDNASATMSIAARASIAVDRSHWEKGGGGGGVSFRRKKKKLNPSKRSTEAIFVLEGLLEKVGGSFGHWTTRWFVLLGDELLYFKQPTDTVPIALLKLNEYKLCRRVHSSSSSGDENRHFLFELVPQNPTARIYSFAAPSAADQTNWIRKIDCSIPGRRCYCQRVGMLKSIYDHCKTLSSLINDDLFRSNGSEQRIKLLVYAFGYGHKELKIDDVSNPTDIVRLLKKLFEAELVGPFVSCNTQLILQKLLEGGDAEKQISTISSVLNSQLTSASDYQALRDLIEFFEFLLSHATDKATMQKELCRSFGRAVFIFTTKGETLLELILNHKKELLSSE